MPKKCYWSATVTVKAFLSCLAKKKAKYQKQSHKSAGEEDIEDSEQVAKGGFVLVKYESIRNGPNFFVAR